MSKLIVLQGLPASGKSTRCMALLEECGNAVRINRDLLRTMLHCDVWSGAKEGITQDVARTMARYLLQQTGAPSQGRVGVVVIDDTNLTQGTVERWRQVARDCEASFEILRMETPLEECLRRDSLREKSVGRSVIIGMALQAGLYPKPEKGIVICDLDGTLADCTHRLQCLQQEPKDWQGFFSGIAGDTVRADVRDMVKTYAGEGYEIFLVSGRPDNYKEQTIRWLCRHCPDLTCRALFMRRAGDHRPDTVVKEEILMRHFPDLAWISYVIDDRPVVIRMWKTHGLEVIDVGKGIEF